MLKRKQSLRDDRVVAHDRPTLAELKATGLQRSRFEDFAPGINVAVGSVTETELLRANLARFEATIKPILQQSCGDCHGPDTAEGRIRIDALDPDLLRGADVDGWLKIFAAITKGEMPPNDYGEMADDSSQQIVDWLAAELRAASIVQRRSGSESGFRRMTWYEANYALQDLLGLPWNFTKDLPPEAHSEEGFENGSHLLHLSVAQLETFHRLVRNALHRATASGEEPPTRYWNVAMKDAAAREWTRQDNQLQELKEELKDDPEKLAAELEKTTKRFSRTAPGRLLPRTLEQSDGECRMAIPRRAVRL